MANVSITYQDVEDCAAEMRSVNQNTLIPAKDAAKAAIDDGIGTDLIMPKTGAAIEDMYNRVHHSLTLLCDQVESFAHQFVQIKNGMMEFDQKYAENIRQPA
ncbi:hypothetical protein O7599_05740 [Streptomyces sp. WMMC500]|uniref:hypothetical protein n=1 Tax=Streptomyces sp. WMMC500 TaxID=3015154 RepID=UPI00248BA21D|nr:hypothetical protein [Streptomyces sp. WMMC500]WBB62042.1 hypothetical protein O7599_05740 [Streptomyces sp. WMMC500]